MALTQVTGPYPIFTDLDGTPLDDGYLYIGEINQDPEQNPIQVFWDANLLIPATQPIRTSNGYAYRNGTPALIYTAGEFSITIRNKREEFVLYSPVGYGFDPKAVSASVVKNDFVGDGVEVDFVLSAAPSTILATNAFINGVYQEKDSYTLSGNTITFSIAPPLNSSIEIMTNETGIINSGNATAISYTASFAGATAQTVQTKLEQYVSVADFGAVGDGVTDDTAAIQDAIDYCLSISINGISSPPILYLSGKHLITSSLIINRLVDSTQTEFRIIGNGPGQGFYTTGAVTMFDSTLPYTTAPVSEFITFENVQFSTSLINNESFVMSAAFLRIKFINCYFYLIRCVVSTIYIQTYYFISCNIQSNKTNFINCFGLYDVSFNHCIIERGGTIVRCIDAVRGASGLRFIDCLIEAMGTSIVVGTGMNGFNLVGCHLEANFSPEFSFFGGSLTNGSVTATGNYIYNPQGATFYYGPTIAVFSSGNTVFPSLFHSNAVQVANLISCADNCKDINGNAIAPSDATVESIVNGVYRAGTAASVWSDNANQITKDVNGNFAINGNPEVANKLTVLGKDQTSTAFAARFFDGNGSTIASFRNDRKVEMPALLNFANDAAAAAGGVPVGYLYRNGSVVQVRVT
jgi:hypothetical protein